MKNYIRLSILFMAGFMLASCNDWLDVKPSTQLDREELFTSETGYAEAVKGVYTQMCGPSLYGQHMTWGAMDVLAGNYQINYTGVYDQLRQYSYVRGDDFVSDIAVNFVGQFWTGLYKAIAGVNSVLGEIDSDKDLFTEDNYSIIKGEAVGLRAFLHFELLRMFGSVYEISKDKEAIAFAADLSTKMPPMLTGEQAITIIITELQEAVKLLENDPMHLGTTPNGVLASVPGTATNVFTWHNRRFHFNYYAAKAMLARAYLWKGDKTNALKMAQEVIADQETRFPWVLTSNLVTIETGTEINQDLTFATEHIFALNTTKMEDYIKDVLGNTSGFASQKLVSQRDMFSLDEQGADPRYRYMYVSFAVNTPLLSKYYQNSNTATYFKFRMPLIRISEMYYIAAECANDWRDGLEYLETVRRQRGLGSMPLSVVTDTGTLQQEIYNEYRKEFIGEGQLWFYYKRHRYTFITNMNYTKEDRGYVFPMPDNEILYGDRN